KRLAIVDAGHMAEGTLATCNEVFKSDSTPRFYGAPGSLLTTSGSVEQTVKSIFRCQEGLIREQDIAGEIGEVITGKKQGRRSDNEITLFDSTRVALPTVPLEYERALAARVGVEKKMISTWSETAQEARLTSPDGEAKDPL